MFFKPLKSGFFFTIALQWLVFIRVIHRKGKISSMKTNIACENFRGIAVSSTDEKVKIAQLRCKQWSCGYCARMNALQWRAAILDYINSSEHDWSFWTITMPNWIHDKQEHERYETSCLHLQKHWDKFMKRSKRMLGKFEYLRVIEAHKSGVIHVHLLASVLLPDVKMVVRDDDTYYYTQKELKKHATDCFFGYIHDFRNLKDKSEQRHDKYHAGSIAAYVTKYITKDLEYDDQTRKDLRVRKIQTSRGIKRVNVENDEVWKLKSGIYLNEFIGDDRDYHDVTTGHLIDINYFRGGIIYPPLLDETDGSPYNDK